MLPDGSGGLVPVNVMVTISNKSFKQLFAINQFNWLFFGNTAMFFGFFGTILLRSLLAWHLTEDEMALAYVNLLAAVCMFVTSLFAGTLIDRFERRAMLLLAQVVVFSAEATVLILLATDHLTFSFLMVSATATSIAFPFIMPARTAMLVEVVGKLRLAKATALMTAGVNMSRMISPALMGVLSDAVGFEFCYVLLISLHAVSLFCTLRLQRFFPVRDNPDSFLRETFNGFAYIMRQRSLGWCILFGVLPMMIVIPLQNLMVVFVEELWNRGGSGLGIMMAVMGVGGVAGSLVIGLLREGSYVKPLVFSTLVMALFLFFFAHAPSFWLAAVMVLAIYTSSVLSYTLVNTAVQLISEDYIRGRVTTITMMSVSLAPVGTIPLAFATQKIGAVWSLSIAAALIASAVLLFWLLIPSFRQIDRDARKSLS